MLFDNNLAILPSDISEFKNFLKHSLNANYLYAFLESDIRKNIGDFPNPHLYDCLSDDWEIDVGLYNKKHNSFISKWHKFSDFLMAKKLKNSIASEWYNKAFDFHNNDLIPAFEVILGNYMKSYKKSSLLMMYDAEEDKPVWDEDRYFFDKNEIDMNPKFIEDSLYFNFDSNHNSSVYFRGFFYDEYFDNVYGFENIVNPDVFIRTLDDCPFFSLEIAGEEKNFIKYFSEEFSSLGYDANIVSYDVLEDVFDEVLNIKKEYFEK